ncbi:GCN5-related N-acetyltransferase (plasmid) [Haloterrigena turkmenica DSM 5511]|uniref:GCN5-related N-acetyltransferase n=1 Tax=Haloterrigena turkmenica (strain ATCC 51198 / DSM 5511 / JCM 9101 / NCIMB 13204 / VKM B-1734 / 4k) TaxID=543526 RepID=D2S1C7_HALTV|nr:GNAT family N-acetyltransferase [Haloterrigena turkmenica]ADB63174.1 GCN5-related N-acetyltransferase [Haloterrigena turkmenica DSM 5511]
MAIREATVDDIDAIQSVAEESWTRDYPDILSRESIQDGLGEWYSEERIRDSIVWARALMLVAERDDEIVGFAHATWDTNADVGNILRVYVGPDARGDGIGRRLLQETCQTLFEQGVERINAMVLDANELGKAFYDDFGFERTDTEEISIGGDSYRECTYALERESYSTERAETA